MSCLNDNQEPDISSMRNHSVDHAEDVVRLFKWVLFLFSPQKDAKRKITQPSFRQSKQLPNGRAVAMQALAMKSMQVNVSIIPTGLAAVCLFCQQLSLKETEILFLKQQNIELDL